MIEQMIANCFADRNSAHVEHFKTRSYAAHMALDEFYTGVVAAVDAVVEAYQGHVGLIGDVPQADELEGDMVAGLQDRADWLEVSRMEIAAGSNAVANLVDGVTAVYLKAIYKLSSLN